MSVRLRHRGCWRLNDVDPVEAVSESHGLNRQSNRLDPHYGGEFTPGATDMVHLSRTPRTSNLRGNYRDTVVVEVDDRLRLVGEGKLARRGRPTQFDNN